MSCHHVCRRCAATFEPEARSAEALARRVEELEGQAARLMAHLDLALRHWRTSPGSHADLARTEVRDYTRSLDLAGRKS